MAFSTSPHPRRIADWLHALRLLTISSLLGVAVAASLVGLWIDGILVGALCVVVAAWALVAAVPVHLVLGGLQRTLQEDRAVRDRPRQDVASALASVVPLRMS